MGRDKMARLAASSIAGESINRMATALQRQTAEPAVEKHITDTAVDVRSEFIPLGSKCPISREGACDSRSGQGVRSAPHFEGHAGAWRALGQESRDTPAGRPRVLGNDWAREQVNSGGFQGQKRWRSKDSWRWCLMERKITWFRRTR